MPFPLRATAFVIASLAATAAFAQAAPPPPPAAAGPAGAATDAPPPPPPGAPDRAPPPPPPGAHVRIDRDGNGAVRVDIHCTQQETTAACAEIATKLFAQAGGAPSGK